jgi:hypothetical protein
MFQSKASKTSRRPTWQEFIVMGINIPLFIRFEELGKTTDALGLQNLMDVGLISVENGEDEEAVLTCRFDGKYDSFIGYIEDQLKLNFSDAVGWALDFIERNPAPENNDCRCDEEGIECDHSNGVHNA